MPYTDKKNYNKQQKLRYRTRIEKGECPQCRKPLAPNRSRCKECLLYDRMKRMKLSEEDRLKVLEAFKNFEGFCQICAATDSGNSKDWDVDHCHVTNKFRGIICHHCNCVLGYSRDNTEILEKAILYLKKFNNTEQRACPQASGAPISYAL